MKAMMLAKSVPVNLLNLPSWRLWAFWSGFRTQDSKNSSIFPTSRFTPGGPAKDTPALHKPFLTYIQCLWHVQHRLSASWSEVLPKQNKADKYCVQLSTVWGEKKKNQRTPNHLLRGGLKGWLFLNHAGCKGDKTPISPTTKHEMVRKMENIHKERPKIRLWKVLSVWSMFQVA